MTFSAIYEGTVTHRRARPKRHRLKYRIFMLLLDLDEMEGVTKRLRSLSFRKFNLFSFHERDHADGSGAPLRDWVEKQLAQGGMDLNGGAIRLLAIPRILGYGFNPISVWFCHDRDGQLKALLHEVHNTFGERHSYLIPVERIEQEPIRQSRGKTFHVSPFLAMDLRYDFQITPPADSLMLAIRVSDADGLVLTASFRARRTELTDAALLSVFVRIPLLTLKVIGGIHWEALRLWWKGLRIYPHPPPPRHAVTIVPLKNAT